MGDKGETMKKALAFAALAGCLFAAADNAIVNASSGEESAASGGNSVNSGISLDGGVKAVKGDGTLKAETRSVKPFEKIEANGIGSLEIDCSAASDAPSLEIKADGNLLPFIETGVHSAVLKISPKAPLSTANGIQVKIRGAKGLACLAANGQGQAKVEGIDASSFEIDLRGNWTASLSGACKSLTASFRGNCKVDAGELKAGTAAANARGVGELKLQADSVSADLAGPITVLCKGNPQITSKSLLGGGKIESGK